MDRGIETLHLMPLQHGHIKQQPIGRGCIARPPTDNIQLGLGLGLGSLTDNIHTAVRLELGLGCLASDRQHCCHLQLHKPSALDSLSGN